MYLYHKFSKLNLTFVTMADRIIKDIEQIKTILTSALENGSIHALDRDVVSDKLRKLYDIVSSMPVATEYVTEKAAV